MLVAQMEVHRLHPEIGFSFTDHRRFAEDGTGLATGFGRSRNLAACQALRREAFILHGEAQAAICAEPVVATSTVMARTALLRAVGGFNQQLRRAGGICGCTWRPACRWVACPSP